MIIDAHNHILAAGLYPGYERFIKEMTMGYFQVHGSLPEDRDPRDEDWKGLEYLWAPIDPDTLIRDHAVVGVDRCTILAVAPSEYTRYESRGTVDITGVTGVDGPPSIDKGNDYIAALVKKYPDYFIGMSAVNPRFRGVPAAVAELDIPVMVHLSTTPVADTVLLYGWPVLLDDVARAFPNLRLLVCHAGHPWIDECLVLISRHRNVYLDMSFLNSTLDQRETYGFLKRARQLGCPLSRVCWATDYPGFEFPETLLPKLALVNRSAGDDPLVPTNDIARMLGGNYSRFLGIDWSLDETVEQMRSLDEMWTGILTGDNGKTSGNGGDQAPGGEAHPRPHHHC